MSAATDKAAPYRVSYTDRVQDRLRELTFAALARGEGAAFLLVLREFDRRLHIYPQFGDPLSDLVAEVGQVRLGLVPPLSMRYGVFEARREVMVAALPVLLSRRGAE